MPQVGSDAVMATNLARPYMLSANFTVTKVVKRTIGSKSLKNKGLLDLVQNLLYFWRDSFNPVVHRESQDLRN